MKQGWEIKRLEDVVEFQRGLTYSKKDEVDLSDNVVLRSNNVSLLNNKLDFTELKYINPAIEIPVNKKVKKGSLIICTANGSKSHLGKVALIDDDYNFAFGGFMGLVTPKEKLNSNFLFHLLTSDNYKKFISELSDGANINNLKFGDLGQFEVPIPPLPEQQRIVSILDEAFAAIAKAKANAEQNLKNAKELFESYLKILFSEMFSSKEAIRISEVAKVIGGYSFKSGDFKKEGKYQVIRMGNVRPGIIRENESPVFIDEMEEKALQKALLHPNDVIITQTGTKNKRDYGFTVIIEKKHYLLNQRIAAIRFSKEFLPKFFLYYSWSNVFKDQYFANETGTVGQGNVGIGAITNSLILNIPKTEQQTIVRQLDALRIETQKLEAVYQKKIDDLEELKKSVLQKAFAGELTSSISTSVSVAKVIPLQKVNGISATDLQVGITALALQKHIEQNKQHSFHHVKAEKIIHLSEYILNIDLERNPVKDAAGPNDFPHAKKVESRAKKAGFYTVYKKGEYYEYQQGGSINSVIEKAQNCLSEKADTLSQIIDILIPMTTQQTEVVATVYAAWNNLILIGNQFTDEDIVTEARENWHKNKLNIERERFFNAIDWIKKNELLIPKGNGKVVLPKKN